MDIKKTVREAIGKTDEQLAEEWVGLILDASVIKLSEVTEAFEKYLDNIDDETKERNENEIRDQLMKVRDNVLDLALDDSRIINYNKGTYFINGHYQNLKDPILADASFEYLTDALNKAKKELS